MMMYKTAGDKLVRLMTSVMNLSAQETSLTGVLETFVIRASKKYNMPKEYNMLGPIPTHSLKKHNRKFKRNGRK